MFDPNGGWLGVYGALDVLRWGDGAYAWYIGTETYFNHINNIGSTTVLTNHSGAAVQDILYYPWGQMPPWHLWGGGGANFAELPYQDPNTSTNIAMFRFHSPAVGRWLSPDPVAGDITNPQSLNRYAYVMNNPATLVDPLGLGSPSGCIPGQNTATCTAQQASQSNLCSALSIFCGNGVTSTNLEGYFEFSSWESTSWGYQYGDPFASDPELLTYDMFIGTIPLTDLGGSNGCAVSSSAIDKFIAQQQPRSPLIGQGSNFMATGSKYNLDPRLLVSLAGAETTFGTKITAGQFNALNVLYNQKNKYDSPFTSWGSNINGAGKSLTNPKNGYDLSNTSTMYSTYCSGPNCATGMTNLNNFMGLQGAKINSLHNPCKR
jgi:RHS repeat-associated protein